MKKLYTLILIFTSIITNGQADTNSDSLKYLPATLTAQHDGEFSDPKTFGGILPKPGDNVIIPRNVIVTVSTPIDFTDSTESASTIYIAGVLLFQKKGKLKLANGSMIFASPGSFIDRDERENTGVISIGKAIVYGGADTTLTGPLLFPSGSIPETFLNVAILNKNHVNIISWSTVRECRAKNFQILRSTNGTNWEVLSTISAPCNSSLLHTFTYTDNNVKSPVNYYRIKLIDDYGRAQYSFIRAKKNVEENNMTAR